MASSKNFPISKIMIVDDSKINLLLLKSMLKKIVSGASIYEQKNGLEAVMEFGSILPDVIFMDIQMPVMNGYDATRKIRETNCGAKTPIIAVTALTESDVIYKCLDAGMNDFISKPISQNLIEDSLAKCLN